jgi:hypothetical protein
MRFHSPYPDVRIPEQPCSDYVFEHVSQWADTPAFATAPAAARSPSPLRVTTRWRRAAGRRRAPACDGGARLWHDRDEPGHLCGPTGPHPRETRDRGRSHQRRRAGAAMSSRCPVVQSRVDASDVPPHRKGVDAREELRPGTVSALGRTADATHYLVNGCEYSEMWCVGQRIWCAIGRGLFPMRCRACGRGARATIIDGGPGRALDGEPDVQIVRAATPEARISVCRGLSHGRAGGWRMSVRIAHGVRHP